MPARTPFAQAVELAQEQSARFERYLKHEDNVGMSPTELRWFFYSKIEETEAAHSIRELLLTGHEIKERPPFP